MNLKANQALPHQELAFSSGSGRTAVCLRLLRVGKDCQVILTGGEQPQIGAVVLAVPRPSLRGGERSCDCWVTPVSAHKDHLVAQSAAEKLCPALNGVVSVSAGIHSDRASEEELQTIRRNCASTVEMALSAILAGRF